MWPGEKGAWWPPEHSCIAGHLKMQVQRWASDWSQHPMQLLGFVQPKSGED